MNTTLRFTPSLICLALLTAYSLPHVYAADNETDEQGRLIAAPAETDLVERGYLFYPLRVLPKKQTELVAMPQPTTAPAPLPDANSQVKTTDAAAIELVAMKSDDAHSDGHVQAPQSTTVTKPAASDHESGNHGTAPAKPAASSVLVQVVEPVKAAAPAHATPSHGKHGDTAKDEHGSAHDAKPEISKAELAKAERVKAAEARAARLKEEQAKAELAKAERAKIAQAKAEKIKQEQAKAERARAERVMLAAQAKVDKTLDELAKAEKAFALLVNAEAEAAEKANEALAKDEHAKAAPAKAEPAKDEHAKAAPAKAEPAKDEHAKAAPAKAEPAKDEHAKAAPAKAEPAKDEHAKATPSKDAHAKDDHGKDGHGGHAPAPSVASANAPAGQKILFLNRAEPAAVPAAVPADPAH